MGPPGAGKTLLARALPGILPKMTFEEALDGTRIYSVADQLPAETPFCATARSGHPTIPSTTLDWLVVEISLTQEKFLMPITVSYS